MASQPSLDIAVLGGGNGSYAAAADLAVAGHRVRFWRRDAAALAPLVHEGGILRRDAEGLRRVALAQVGADLGAAVRGAQLILVPTPAFAQIDLARALAPHLEDGQVVFMPPGTFGSVLMARLVRAAGCRAAVAFAEAGTLPWLARKRGPAEVAISSRATRLPSGVFPARLAEPAFAILEAAFPAIERVEDGLSAALMNAGPIIHPPLILMNAGPIEHFEHWDIHNEGTQPSIRRVTNVLDGERIDTRIALGYRAPHFPLADHYSVGGEAWMYGDASHEKLVDSGDWRERLVLTEHRYMREDVALGLAFLVSVADWAGVPCDVGRGLLAVASAVVGEDLRRGPRTLEALGLAGLGRRAMSELLHEGWA